MTRVNVAVAGGVRVAVGCSAVGVSVGASSKTGVSVRIGRDVCVLLAARKGIGRLLIGDNTFIPPGGTRSGLKRTRATVAMASRKRVHRKAAKSFLFFRFLRRGLKTGASFCASFASLGFDFAASAGC